MKFYHDKNLGLLINIPLLLALSIFSYQHYVLGEAVESIGFLNLVLLVGVYPLLEEYVFRGLFQTYCLKKLQGSINPWLSFANLITSVVFACSHLLVNFTLLSVLTFFPSLIYGYYREKYNTIAPCVGLHVSFNCTYLLLSH
ncbi:MAG: JDVT-CTERM system glutamic-type intramembrane protease [Gammaproteobacteria bacterium]|nr:JDVT-CTERM system glutamic-type intramembrane protease [Gammaproteobacteria bacterium]